MPAYIDTLIVLIVAAGALEYTWEKSRDRNDQGRAGKRTRVRGWIQLPCCWVLYTVCPFYK